MPELEAPVRVGVRRIIGIQVAVSCVIALLLAALYGTTIALSAFAGGAIGFIASSVYAQRMAVQGSDPQALLRGHYVAEFSRFGVTVALFAAVFLLFRNVAALPLFLTYVATLVVYWVALLLK